mgnify:CR=1 FL=1
MSGGLGGGMVGLVARSGDVPATQLGTREGAHDHGRRAWAFLVCGAALEPVLAEFGARTGIARVGEHALRLNGVRQRAVPARDCESPRDAFVR